jgi:hypothetical protein
MTEPATIEEKRTMGAKSIAACLCVAAMALIFGAHADSADAKSKIFQFAANPTTSQAGGHPDIFTSFELGSRSNQEQVPCECNDPKDILTHLPAGVIANPHVVSECQISQFLLKECPSDSQAGLFIFKLATWLVAPIYRTPVQPGQAGLFVFEVFPNAPIYISFSARTGSDYGLDTKTLGSSHFATLPYYGPTFWGVPGDKFFDPMRFAPGAPLPWEFCAENPTTAMEAHDAEALAKACPLIPGKTPVPSSLPIAPLTQNPTTCTGPLTSELEVLSYDLEWDRAIAPWPATTGCDKLSFNPSLAANPTTTNADTASGLEVVLKVPQYQDPNVPSPSTLRASTITLPEGFSLNPNAADGKTSCSDEQSRVGTEEEARCPEHSKVGTVSIDSSSLPAPIHGFIYLGEPKPGEPYRLVLTANGFGTAVKLLGTVHADPGTGRLVTSFDELPQTTFQEFVLHFFGSERGLLATPAQCGTYPVQSTFVPWARELSDQTLTQFFVLDHGPNGRPCPAAVRGFNPGLAAGSLDNTAAEHTPFELRITREDGEQNLTAATIATPPGLLASLRGVPYCPEAAIARLSDASHGGRAELSTPSCPAASLVGSATAGVGAGTHPLHTAGKIHLAGPYKGAPLSLVVSVPAVSGPYDLGNVAVRVAVYVDPATTELTAVSDPLPRIVAGIPLRVRLIQLELDRRNFMLNPTNCDPFAVTATIDGDQGGQRSLGVPFQIANCNALPFEPELSLAMRGGVNRRGHPAIRVTLKAKPGEANLRRVSVTLPDGQLLDNDHLKAVCTRVQYARDACPPGSTIGRAMATSPLIDRPLEGKVILRTSTHDLPDLVLDLKGQVDVEAVARVDSVKERMRAVFQTLPDAPLSKVVVNLAGGKKGLLINSEGLCGAKKRARARLTAQNGAVMSRKLPVRVACGAGKKNKRNAKRAVR